MKESRYTAEQVAFALRQAESGTQVAEVCRKMGISEQTFYRWKKRYAGMGGCQSQASPHSLTHPGDRQIERGCADVVVPQEFGECSTKVLSEGYLPVWQPWQTTYGKRQGKPYGERYGKRMIRVLVLGEEEGSYTTNTLVLKATDRLDRESPAVKIRGVSSLG